MKMMKVKMSNMEIKIDEEVLKTYIEETVNKKIETLTDEIIKDRVNHTLLDKVDGILGAYRSDIKHLLNKHIREHVEGICPTIDEKILKSVGKSIAHSITWELRDKVLESIAYRLMPDKEDESEDD